MKRFLHHCGANIVAGCTLALFGLFLMSSSKPACAGGYWMYSDTEESPQPYQQADPGSSANISPGQTSSVSAYSNYAGQPGENDTSATVYGTFIVYFVWVNADGNTPSAQGNYTTTKNSSIDGGASPSGATAQSSTDEISSSAPPSYSTTNTDPLTQDLTGKSLAYTQVDLAAKTTATPDSSYDPKQENYGGPTAGACGASVGVTLSPAGQSS